MNPKEIYLHAKKLKIRYEQGENVLVRPYNFKLRRFVTTKQKQHHKDMFVWGIAYLRNILNRSPKIIKEQYQKKLEKQLIKYFHPESILNYARAIGQRLPEELHNRALLEAMGGDFWLLEYLKEYGGQSAPKKWNGAVLSKPKEIYNCLVDNPNATNEQIIKELWKKGIKVNKATVTKIKNKIEC
jgi:hypothetical protein